MKLLFNIVTALVVCGLLLGFVYGRLNTLYGELPTVAESDPEAKALFDAAWRQQLITVNHNGRIQLVSEDAVLARRAAGDQLHEAELKAHQQMIDLLYARPAGQLVQQQVARWNRQREIAAVRDNRQQPGQRARWRVEHRHRVVANSSAPLAFGYLNEGTIPAGFHDWYSIIDGDDIVHFTTDFVLLESQTVTIQVIGTPDLSAVDLPLELYECFPEAPCQAVDSVGDATAYKITLNLNKGLNTLTLPVQSTVNPEKSTMVSPIYVTSAGQPLWDAKQPLVVEPTTLVKSPQPIKIITADGVPLTENSSDGEPRASPFSLKSGLVSLIGEHQQVPGTLSELIWDAPRSSHIEVTLTVNSRLQQIAQQVLLQQLKKLPPSPLAQRRAAVVFLDPQSGALLATANYPDQADPQHLWDRSVASASGPVASSSHLISGWQGVDENNQTGTLFQLVIALAALTEATTEAPLIPRQEGLLTTLLEGVTVDSMASLSVTKPSSSRYVINSASAGSITVANPAGALKRSFNQLLRRADCDLGEPVMDRLGLREAFRDSLLSWFVRVAVIMDQQRLLEGGDKTQLVTMAQQLGFDQQQSLLSADIVLDQGAPFTVVNGSLGLATAKVGSDVTHLVDSALGQTSRASPLQMAKVAAMIATGKLLTPYLVERWGDQLTAPQRPTKLTIAGLPWLREGLKAVPEVGRGKLPFSSALRCHLFGLSSHPKVTIKAADGKKKKPSYSSWFVGWYGDQPQQPEFSFSCFVSQVGKKNSQLCGEIIGQIIERWTIAEEQ